ncbi:hypothetical protein ADUPG1_005221, partial [Aduncisulcus paluster]
LKTMSHSEIQATNPLKLTVVEPGQTGSSANGVFIERLTSDDTDDVKEFLKKIQELKTTHHDLIIPPFSQLMPPVSATLLGYVLEDPIAMTCTNQIYLTKTIEKAIKAFTPDDMFRKFMLEAEKIVCETNADGESISMKQAYKYTASWSRLRMELLEGREVDELKESKIVDLFVDGIRPFHFRNAIKEAVEHLRTLERHGSLETT